jgi:DNA-binding response OmpR family regulator
MRILIAEDDQVLADGLLRSLRASGARSTTWRAAAKPTRR